MQPNYASKWRPVMLLLCCLQACDMKRSRQVTNWPQTRCRKAMSAQLQALAIAASGTQPHTSCGAVCQLCSRLAAHDGGSDPKQTFAMALDIPLAQFQCMALKV